ncbi:MAG: methionyl-tRNA formyltransferase [Candidatus Latescibacteria bacterium]|nr:methionyl-tRNA formyltransferase [Candidatus Latescibacterota bacterium]
MRVIFWGTSDFAVPSLERIYEHGYEIACVVTAPEKQAGRGLKLVASPVKTCAEKLGLNCLEPDNPNTDEVFYKLKQMQPDVCVLAAYGFLIKSQLLNLAPKGFINIHPSLLPKYRGAAPIQRTIMNGEKTTGVTTFYMNEAMDAGDIILQTDTGIDQDETYDELRLRLGLIGADLIVKTLSMVRDDKVNAIAQNSTQKTLAKKIKKEECLINWNKPVIEIHNLIRGLSQEPGAYTHFRGKRLRILKSKIPEQILSAQLPFQAEHGMIVTSKRYMFVNTSEGIIQLLSLQIEGGKILNAIDFMNGQRIKPAEKFE